MRLVKYDQDETFYKFDYSFRTDDGEIEHTIRVSKRNAEFIAGEDAEKWAKGWANDRATTFAIVNNL